MKAMGRLAVFLAFSVYGCTSKSTGGLTVTTSTPTVSMATIGLAGGHVATSDGSIDVFVPYGAVTSNVMVSIHKIDAPAAGSVGTVFEIGPSGMTFARRISITFHYQMADLGATDPETLAVATFQDGLWRLYPSQTDRGAGTVAADVTHFSPWAVVLPGSGVDATLPPADASVPPDAPIDVGGQRDASADVGGGRPDASGGGGGAKAGAGGSAGGHAGAGGGGGGGGAGGGAAGMKGSAGSGGGGGDMHGNGGAGGSGGMSGRGGASGAGAAGSAGGGGSGGQSGRGGSGGESGQMGAGGSAGNGDSGAPEDSASGETGAP
jgi:hypothetical protein